MELVVAGADAAELGAKLAGVAGAQVTQTPSGARVEVRSERDVDAALAALRSVEGARLVSVQPVGNPLEELFAGDN